MRTWIKSVSIGLFGVVVIIVVATAQVFAAIPHDEKPIVTQQQIKIDGKQLKYTTEVGRVAIRDVETGEPHGYMFYTAYRIPSLGKSRPITFVWNGGPGANSSLLHFSVSGPKIVENRKLIDNPDTWLTVTDLVLVDPIGTGFSRPAKTEYASEFYNTLGDVASITEFIRSWRLLHGVEDTPIFLAGESWGAERAANVSYELEKRGKTVNGLILISGGWGLNKDYCVPAELCSALQVVDMATTAFYYHKTAPDLGKDLSTLQHSAETWVRKVYAPALAHIANLSKTERTQIISQLSRFTGLSPQHINSKTLIITPYQFRTNLLRDQNKEAYLFDMRRTSARGIENVPVILHYFRHELGFQTDLLYIGLEDLNQGFAPTGTYPTSVNKRWNYATIKMSAKEIKKAEHEASMTGSGPPKLGLPLPGIEAALLINSKMKVLVAVGMYDSFLPCATGKETERQLPSILKQSITFKCYPGGHAMYEDPSIRTEFSKDVKTFMTTAIATDFMEKT